MNDKTIAPAGYPEAILAFVIIMTLSFTFREILFSPNETPNNEDQTHYDLPKTD